ncbi:MAG TPA: hypothetical protein VHO69_18975, partial [Phototrophicaceae bacterium]|nr:hypothetical protein [Phototrophicaceae bacterium]
TDPFFTDRGFAEAVGQLQLLEIGFGSIGYIFVSHYHYDHMPRLPAHAPQYAFKLLVPGESERFPDVRAVDLPGHDPFLRALAFTSIAGKRVWVVGDAILNEEWLRAWEYYWPNGYEPDEIMQTWRSTAVVLAEADVILPGHGQPILITPDLLRALAAGFTRAEYAERCPDVLETLHHRLAQIGP